MPDFDMHRIRNVHFIGIGGCGMSGIAKVLHEMGYKVSGSDVREGPNTIRLKDMNIKVYIDHAAANVRDADILVYSSAVAANNPELAEGRSKGIPIIQRAEMLAWIMDQSQNRIAVSGTHGKTTTSAMISKVLDSGNFNPTYFIGCDMDYAEGNARLGNGHFAVAEADESDKSFLFLSPTVEIITNVEDDHMERFGTSAAVLEAFRQFTLRLTKDGLILLDAANPNNQVLMKEIQNRLITYGLEGNVDFSADKMKFNEFSSRFILLHKGKKLGEVELSVPGWQNVLNSLPVFALGLEFGMDFHAIAGALRTFIGARRRFQTVGELDGVLVVDDYAHHPTELRATLSAARAGWPGRRIIAIFQPHRYSRTLLLKDRFGEAFADADKIIITDVYAASEAPIPGISGQTIVDSIVGKDVTYVPRKEKIAELIIPEIREGDIILTLGAGDIYTTGREILSRLKMKDQPA